MSEKKLSGSRGEEMAAKMLSDGGYTILERNWRTGKLEIDIIARKGEELIIAEVKTRSTREYGDPASFVSMKQQRNLIKAANAYVFMHNLYNEVRFDVFSVFDYGTGMEIEHIEDAFYPLVGKSKIY